MKKTVLVLMILALVAGSGCVQQEQGQGNDSGIGEVNEGVNSENSESTLQENTGNSGNKIVIPEIAEGSEKKSFEGLEINCENAGQLKAVCESIDRCSYLEKPALTEICEKGSRMPQNCEKITEDMLLIDRCQRIVIAQERNPSVCDLFETPGRSDFCLLILGIELEKEEMCDMIKGEVQQAECYRNMVLIKHEKSTCEKFKGDLPFISKLRYECYWQVAIYNDDFSLCHNIADETIREGCENDQGIIWKIDLYDYI